MKKCPDCNSEKIIENAAPIDQNHHHDGVFSVAVDEYPNAPMFNQRVYSGVRAHVCGDCGFIQFRAENPGIL